MTRRPQLTLLLTDAQQDALKDYLAGRKIAFYLRSLIAEDFQANGRTWPDDMPKPGPQPTDKQENQS